MVLDVWLDLSGAVVAASVALVVLAGHRPPRGAGRGGARRRGHGRLHRGSGPACGCGGARPARPPPASPASSATRSAAVLAVQAGGAEQAVGRRFAELNAASGPTVGRRDQVGSELVRSLGYGTGEVAAGVVLVVVARRFRRRRPQRRRPRPVRRLRPVIAELPKWVGRYLVIAAAGRRVGRPAGRAAARRPTAAPWSPRRPRTCATGRPPLAAPAAPAHGGRRRPDGLGASCGARRVRLEGLTVRHPGSGRGIERRRPRRPAGRAGGRHRPGRCRARRRCCGRCSASSAPTPARCCGTAPSVDDPSQRAGAAPGRLPAPGAPAVQRAARRHDPAGRGARRARRTRCADLPGRGPRARCPTAPAP